jgi:hypothetical protein
VPAQLVPLLLQAQSPVAAAQLVWEQQQQQAQGSAQLAVQLQGQLLLLVLLQLALAAECQPQAYLREVLLLLLQHLTLVLQQGRCKQQPQWCLQLGRRCCWCCCWQ